MTISIIIPYLEPGKLIVKTANSVNKQNSNENCKLDLLVIDATAKADAKKRLSKFNNVKVIACPNAKNEAEAFNAALDNLTADYAIVARVGDTFDSGFFSAIIEAANSGEDWMMASPRRRCINPIYSQQEHISRLNFGKKYFNRMADINELFTLMQIEIFGNVIKSDILKKYPADVNLKFEYFHDVMIRLQDDYPRYYAMEEAWFNSFMPLSDDSLYYIPANHKEWYKESIDEFLIPLAEREKQKHNGKLPKYIQYYLMYAVALRFKTNMNNRNKRNMTENEIEEFFVSCRKLLAYIDDKIILNVKKYKPFGYGEEAAEMYYMLKHEQTLSTMDQKILEGKDDIILECSDLAIAKMQEQKIELYVLDYSDGKLLVDGMMRQIFNPDKISLYAVWNEKEIKLENNDNYSLTKYFGISAYKKFSFHLELPIDDSLPKNRLKFYAHYKKTNVVLQFSYLLHWAKFTDIPKAGYWRFNKYMATVRKNMEIIIVKAKKKQIYEREKKFLKNLKKEDKRCYYVRIAYWLTRPFFKHKRIWLMYDKLYKGGDSCEYLYRYCKGKRDGITRYYIVDKDTPDYANLKKDGYHPVKNGSVKHRLAMLNTDIALITNSRFFAFNGYNLQRSRYIRDLCNFPTVCLQHGLSVQKCALAQRRVIDNTRLYFIASKAEEKNLIHPVYGYNGLDIIKKTGIGRYDGLINNDQKQILITPTWRMYNAMPVTTSEGEQRAYNPDFKNTVYYKIYNDLINNQQLINTAKKTGYSIKYLLHPILSAQVNDYTPDPYVEVISSVGDTSYEKLLTESSLMVTDYSGVQFDFAYMKKPIVYFQPDELPAHYDEGGFFYDEMGFGEICSKSDELVKILCDYMNNGCKIKDEYRERMDEFFYYDDHNNCERIYNELIKLQDQIDRDKCRKVRKHK